MSSNGNNNYDFNIENNTISYSDKSSYKSVFITNMLVSLFLSLFVVFSCISTKYSDIKKNTYKWLGWFVGVLMQLSMGMLIVGIVFTIQKQSSGYVLLPVGLVCASLLIVWFIKIIKNTNK